MSIELTSRDEELLKAILGEGLANFEPQSRIEALLKRILDEGGMGGGGTRILGYYDTLEELEAAHPTGNINDAYLVGSPSHIYVWLTDVDEWHDGGQFEAIPGEPGVGIASIVKTATVGLVDTYTITYDDLSTTTFNVTNGRDGTDGNGIVSVVKTSTAGLVDTYTITFDDGNYTTFDVTNGIDGAPGRDGIDGIDGNGIASIVKTATAGLVDTYTITYTDGNFTTFDVTNGIDGAPGRDGTDGTDGVSVTNVALNSSGHLIVTLSNGNTVDAGKVPASNGYPTP